MKVVYKAYDGLYNRFIKRMKSEKESCLKLKKLKLDMAELRRSYCDENLKWIHGYGKVKIMNYQLQETDWQGFKFSFKSSFISSLEVVIV